MQGRRARGLVYAVLPILIVAASVMIFSEGSKTLGFALMTVFIVVLDRLGVNWRNPFEK